MPKYRVTDPDSGQSLVIEGDSPPTEIELEDIFRAQPTPAPKLNLASPESSAPSAIADVQSNQSDDTLSSPSAWETFRGGSFARRLFGPTDIEREGMAGGNAGSQVGLLEIPQAMLNMTRLGLPPVKRAIEAVTDPVFEALPAAVSGVAKGVRDFALETPIAPIPGATSGKAGMAVLGAFGAQYLSNLPDAYKQFKSAVDNGDVEGAAKIAAENALGGALLTFGAKHGIDQLKTPIEKGIASALKNDKTAAVHGDVREQPIEGEQAVPAEEGGAGIQPPKPAPEVAPTSEKINEVIAQSDFDRYNELKDKIKNAKTAQENFAMAAEVQPEIEAIKNRNGGNPSIEPVVPVEEALPPDESVESIPLDPATGNPLPPKQFGMGAATPAEFAPEKEFTTSIKNATVDAERESRGLPPAMAVAKRDFGKVWDDAIQKLDDDPTVADNLVDELKQKPRALTDTEDAILLHRQIELQNAYEKSANRLNEAFDNGDMDAVAEYRIQAGQLSDKLLDLYNAGKSAGTETGRGLNARKMLANEDFSLAKMVTDKRAANDGKQLSEDQALEVQRLHDKIAATQKAHDDYVAITQQRISELESKKAIESIQSEKPETVVDPHVKSIADRIVESIENQADLARKRLKLKFASLGSSPDPTILADLAVIGASHIARGTLNFSRWSVAMVGEFGDKIKPHLQEVFDLSSKHLDDHIERKAGKYQAPKVKSALTPPDQSEVVTGLKDAIKTRLEDGRKDEISGLVQRLARSFVASGIKEREPLIDAVHGALKEINPEITRRDAMDAISGYGDFRQLSKDEISVQLRDLKGQMQQVAKLEDITQKNQAPLKTGVERRTPSDEERRLIQQVNEAKKKHNIQTVDPVRQLKSTLDSIKTRLKNQISDLDFQITSGKKTVREKTTPPTTPEIDALRTQRDALKSKFDEIFGKPELTDEQRVKIAMASTERSIADLEDRIKNGVLKPQPKVSNTPSTPELEALRARRLDLRGQLDALIDADTGIQAEKNAAALQSQKRALEKGIAEQERKLKEGDLAGKPPQVNRPAHPELEELRQKRDSLNRQLAEARKKPEAQKHAEAIAREIESINKKVKEREAKISAGDLSTNAPAKQVNRPAIQALEEAKQRLEAVNSKMEELRKAARPKKSQEEKTLAALKTRLRNRIEELQSKLAAGDFSPTTRNPVKLDAETSRLKAENENAKLAFKRGLMADKLKKRSALEKAQDTFVKWRRGFILSGPVTLAKLTSAAVERLGFSALEEGIGAGISKVIPGIASKAPREGGFSANAEAKAIAEAFTKGMADAWKTIKTGHSDLDSLYGRPDLVPRTMIDFIGAIHGALKAPVKRAEFARSFEKRTQAAIRAGLDVTDPMVQSRIALDSYKDANRSIFMQDNRVVSAYKRGLSAFDEKNKSTGKVPVVSKLASTALRVALPIVKIPTNIVAETFQYTLGSVTGSARLANAFRNGFETLAPEQADLIMRDLKKGSVGAALLLLGYFNPQSVGGYYQPGEKRKKDDVKVGRVRLYGVDIPSYLVHNSALEAMQVGATVRRVSDSKIKKTSKETHGIGEGVMAGALGLTEEVPFVRDMLELSKAFEPHERGAFLGELSKSVAVPQLVQWLATQFDKDKSGETTKRKPTNLVEHIETGIPGLRKNVPKSPSQ